MIFSFNFGLYPQDELRRLAPHLIPIMDGLASAGHRVERFAIGLKPSPVVNILTHHRRVAVAAVDEVISLKRQGPDALRLGLLCLGPVNDEGDNDMPDNGASLGRLGEAADFVWSVPPPESVPGLAAAAGKAAQIRYGFSERSLGAKARPDAALPRDIDVLFRGIATARRQAVWDALARNGVSSFWLDNANFPDYLTRDLLSRSQIVLDFNPEPVARGHSPALTAQALHHGSVVVSESGNTGWQMGFDAFTVLTPYDALADRCLQVLHSGFHAQLGLAALQKFSTETSMRDNMAAVMKLPFFAQLAGL